MKLQDMNPSIDDIINVNPRVLFGKLDVWKQDADGVHHRLSTQFGEKLTGLVPDVVPMKYKGRKLTSLCAWCDACENVTALEAHYGVGGRVLSVGPDNGVQWDITYVYRAACKSGKLRYT